MRAGACCGPSPWHRQTGLARLRTLPPHQFAAEESRVNIRGSGIDDGTCVISMLSAAERCMVVSLGRLHKARIIDAREPQGANFGAPAMVSPNSIARSRRPLSLACLRQVSWTVAAADMDGTKGREQRILSLCGKVPYRIPSGFRPVKQLPFPCLPDTIDHPTRRYNHKGFGLSPAGFEAHPRKRKKEGWYLTLASTGAGGAGLTPTPEELLRSECQ